MDENEFRNVYETVNDLRCVFEKAVLTRMFACRNLVRMNIAEREAAGCADPAAQRQCDELLDRTRRNASFALRVTHVSGPLPHAKELKVQCGGLLGLQTCLEERPPDPSGVDDIHGLVERARRRFGGLERLPYQELIRSVSDFQGRRRRSRR